MNLDQAKAMLALQDSMNAKVNPDWRTAGYNWLRAVIVEGAEAIEHHGWKWWKKQEPNMAQVRVELVDIWHFYLSHMIEFFEGDTEMVASVIVDGADTEYIVVNIGDRQVNLADMVLLDKLDLIVGCAAFKNVPLPLFFSACRQAGMNDEMLYRMYVAKNVLNFFRQDYGYKDGSYLKIWEGREDNEWMLELAEALPVDADFQTNLYAALRTKYMQVIHVS